MKQRNTKGRPNGRIAGTTPTASSRPARKPRIGDMAVMPGGRKAVFTQGEDSNGRRAEHFRIVDTLGTMLRKGTINIPMYDAATLFGADFHTAGLLGVRSINYASVGGEATGASTTEKAALARHRVHKALDAVGGIGSLGGGFLWHVAGMGMQMNEWAVNTPWNGRNLTKDEARGIAIGALQMLAAHYGYQPRLYTMRQILTNGRNVPRTDLD